MCQNDDRGKGECVGGVVQQKETTMPGARRQCNLARPNRGMSSGAQVCLKCSPRAGAPQGGI